MIGTTAAGPAPVIAQIRDAGIPTLILPDDDRLSAAWTKIADVGTSVGITGLRPVTAVAMVATAPEVILIPAGGMESVGGIDGVLRLPGVALTPAGRQRRILAFDDGYLLGLGPRTGRALRDLVAALHPATARASR